MKKLIVLIALLLPVIGVAQLQRDSIEYCRLGVGRDFHSNHRMDLMRLSNQAQYNIKLGEDHFKVGLISGMIGVVLITYGANQQVTSFTFPTGSKRRDYAELAAVNERRTRIRNSCYVIGGVFAVFSIFEIRRGFKFTKKAKMYASPNQVGIIYKF